MNEMLLLLADGDANPLAPENDLRDTSMAMLSQLAPLISSCLVLQAGCGERPQLALPLVLHAETYHAEEADIPFTLIPLLQTQLSVYVGGVIAVPAMLRLCHQLQAIGVNPVIVAELWLLPNGQCQPPSALQIMEARFGEDTVVSSELLTMLLQLAA